jgi:hypothetical protein
MDFRIDCPCGEHLTVSEGSAGATLECSCGRPISVPSLQALRASVGLPRVDLGPEQVIAHLLAAGKLPGTKACIHCGLETNQILLVRTECELQYLSESRTPVWLSALIFFVFLPVAHVFFSQRGGDGQLHGRDTVLLLPIPACERCERALGSRKRLQKGMRQIPEYRRLLEKFPWARVELQKR